MDTVKQNHQIPEWLGRTLGFRIDEVCDQCDEHSQKLYHEFISKLSLVIPIDSPQYRELENLYILQIRIVVEKAYPLGLSDGLTFVPLRP